MNMNKRPKVIGYRAIKGNRFFKQFSQIPKII